MDDNANLRVEVEQKFGPTWREHHLEDEEAGGWKEPDGNLWTRERYHLYCFSHAISVFFFFIYFY